MSSNSATIKASFLISCIFLGGTSFITFIEALKTADPVLRHIMNLETAVSIVAGYVYSIFVDEIGKHGFRPKEINLIRYADWAITTPLLLLALSLFLAYTNGKLVWNEWNFFVVLVLNLVMIGTGYIGELNRGNDPQKTIRYGIYAFIAYALLFLYLFFTLLRDKAARSWIKIIFFFSVAVLWKFYGIVYYWKDDIARNIAYNVLDCLSKGCIGLTLWIMTGQVLG
jgi:bacteriorhodopsin